MESVTLGALGVMGSFLGFLWWGLCNKVGRQEFTLLKDFLQKDVCALNNKVDKLQADAQTRQEKVMEKQEHVLAEIRKINGK